MVNMNDQCFHSMWFIWKFLKKTCSKQGKKSFKTAVKNAIFPLSYKHLHISTLDQPCGSLSHLLIIYLIWTYPLLSVLLLVFNLRFSFMLNVVTSMSAGPSIIVHPFILHAVTHEPLLYVNAFLLSHLRWQFMLHEPWHFAYVICTSFSLFWQW